MSGTGEKCEGRHGGGWRAERGSRYEWKQFTAAAPPLEALSAGAIETALVGDPPFTFAAASKVPVKAVAVLRQIQQGLAILVPDMRSRP